MTREEKAMIDRLLSSDASETEIKQVLVWMGEYFEEDYILDLARSKDCLNALKRFSGSQSKASPGLKKKALALARKYE